MSDFTNDMTYPKRGSILFDTKDLVEIEISKTGGDRSVNIAYSDPETGETIQTGGGGGIPNEKLFTFAGQDIMSEDCIVYISNTTANGRQAHAYLGSNFTLHLTENDVCTATIKVGGQQYTGSGTVTKIENLSSLSLSIGFNNDAFGLYIDDYGESGTMVEVSGDGISNDVANVYAATIPEAIEGLAAAWQALELVITIS